MINERIKRILLLLDKKQIRRIKRTDKEYVYLFACCLDEDDNVAVTVKCSNNYERGLLNQYEVILYSEVVKQILKTLKL